MAVCCDDHFIHNPLSKLVYILKFTHHIHLDVVTSTSDVARELLNEVDCVVVSANHQTKGRGRRGRPWHDEERDSALVSFGIRHKQQRSTRDLSADMARGCLAVLMVLRAHAMSSGVRCKYPNDIQAIDKGVWSKLSGVLIEHDFMGSICHTTIIGIGVNVRQQAFPETIGQPATSLYRLGLETNLSAVIDALKAQIELLTDAPADEVFKLWERELQAGASMIAIYGDGGVWTVKGLDENGRLVVENINDGTQRIIDDGDTLRYLD